jgi:prepilin-type N-terminal cleavage/methylation domain-containing protein
MKAKGFTLIELMVVMLIVSLLVAVAIPVISGKVQSKVQSKEQVPQKQSIAIVELKNDSLLIHQNINYKIILKPAFQGPNVDLYLTEIPDNAEVIIENGRYYLLWTPMTGSTLRTTIITSAPNLMKEQDVTIFVK